MFTPQQAITYEEMCAAEGVRRLQQGMNFGITPTHSVLLMSVRPGAPYRDTAEDEGSTIVYEGHDVRRNEAANPRAIDQPLETASGKATQNALFFAAALAARSGEREPEPVRMYDKVRKGLWVYNGLYLLIDAWQESVDGRNVFKFKLELAADQETPLMPSDLESGNLRFIPSAVKRAVWTRDGGKCVLCGSTDQLHFDHDYPFSKGGASHVAENIRILCARHNLEKGAKIV